MTNVANRALYWAPRGLSILFLIFLSLFALDVFSEGRGFWQTLLALFIHLIPVFVLAIVVALAWRWEWIGALVYAGAAALYIYWMGAKPTPLSVRLGSIAVIAGPAIVIALLFLAGWLKHDELRAHHG
jgi:hypothetical protein